MISSGGYLLNYILHKTINARAPLIAQLVKNPPAIQETWVQSLSWEDLLEEGKGYPLQYSGLENSMDCINAKVADILLSLKP